MKLPEPDLTFLPYLSSSGSGERRLVELSTFRFLTRAMVEEFLFAGTALTPLSRQVITRRALRRLPRPGLIPIVRPRKRSDPVQRK